MSALSSGVLSRLSKRLSPSTGSSKRLSLLPYLPNQAYRIARAVFPPPDTAAVNVCLFHLVNSHGQCGGLSRDKIDRIDNIFVLLTLRAETISTHKNQVAFPGGRLDQHDAG